jgi:hypothetical protein
MSNFLALYARFFTRAAKVMAAAANAGGQVAGWYQDAAGTLHGFIASVPEPTDE